MGLSVKKNYTYQITGFKKFSENPFLKDLRIPVIPKSNIFIKKDEAIVNLADGELKNDVLLTGKKKYVDGEQFVKIFVNEMKALFELSRPAQKVFSYMLSRIKYDDLLHFDIEECLKNTDYKSRPPIYSAIGELLKNEFIAKTKNQFVYWINPKLFYKGDRLVIVREYRKAKHKELIPNQIDLFKETKALQEKLDRKDTHSKKIS